MPKVAACVIFRDEERWLPVTIPTWVPCVDELVLVDTGSEDGSRRVALEALGLDPLTPWNARYPIDVGGRVLDLKLCETSWEGQASARNYAALQAFGPWVLAIDADEVLVSAHPDTLRGYVAMAEAVAYEERGPSPAIAFQVQGPGPEGGLHHLRCFRWPDGWRWQHATDPVPVLSSSVPYGVLQVMPDTCHIWHLRSSVRSESLERKRQSLVDFAVEDPEHRAAVEALLKEER